MNVEINKQYQNRKYVQYYIDMKCQNSCEYCYVLDELNKKENSFNNDVFEKLIEEYNRLDIKSIDFIGGEPLFQIDKIDEFIKRTNCESYRIYTNLNFKKESVIFNKFIELIKNHQNLVIDISWHDSSKNNIFNNIREVIKNNTTNIIDVTLLNHDEFIYSIKKKLLKYYKIKFKTIPIRDENYDKKNYDINKLEYISYKYFVKCPLNVLNLHSNGDIQISCSYNYKSNIFKNGLDFKTVLCKNNSCGCLDYIYKIAMNVKDNDNIPISVNYDQ